MKARNLLSTKLLKDMLRLAFQEKKVRRKEGLQLREIVYICSAPQWELPYDLDRRRPPDSSFYLGGRPYSELVEKKHEEEELVEIHHRDFPPDDREPEFKNKVEEDIWRLKNKK